MHDRIAARFDPRKLHEMMWSQAEEAVERNPGSI